MNLKKKHTIAGIGTVAAGAVVAGAVIIPLNVANADNTPAPTANSATNVLTAKAQKKAEAKKRAEAKKKRQAAREQNRFAEAKRWAATSKAQSVISCESNGNYKLQYGSYYGAWQFDRGTWLANGGGKFAPTANLASKAQQDYIAWKTWKARGWQPWACA